MGRSSLRIACVVSVLSGLAAGQDADPFAADLREDHVQLDLPGLADEDASGCCDAPARGGGSAGDEGEGDEIGIDPVRAETRERPRDWNPISFAFDRAAVLAFLGWAVLAALLVLAIVAAVTRRSGRRLAAGAPASSRAAPSRSPAVGPDEPPPIGEIERLARDGRFTAAIHLLLLRAIASLAKAARATPGPAATSRELARQWPLGPESRAAFSRLVSEVERSHFGGAEATRERFEACLEAHRVIEGAEPR